MARKRTFGNYFSFKYMITPDIIKIIHVIGIIIINLALIGGLIVGIFFLFSADWDLEGYMMALLVIGGILGSIIVFFIANIEWRMFCEWLILFFSMHEMLSTVEGEVKEVNKKVVEHPVPEDDEEEEEEEDDD